MISVIFIFLAAVCNSFMDAVDNEVKFNQSIFKKWSKARWCKEYSWQFTRKIFGYHIDPWHLSKSLMIIFFGVAVITSHLNIKNWEWFTIYLVIYGAIWNLTFKLFYNVIFGVK